jgi:membrane-bound serine protease (ClpP class)
MRRLFRLPLFLLALLAFALPTGAREVVHGGDTVVIPLNGEVAPAMHLFLRRAVKAAENAGAGAIVIEMNTYGGRLDAAADICEVLNRITLPTYTFINSNAGSAGSLIALATRHIYMSPVSAIGAAAPVLAGGGELTGTEKDKTLSYWSALVRSSATRNGHNPDIGEAFMDKEKEVKIGDRMVHAKGKLLTLNAQEATEIINGKPLLADGIADSVSDLAKKAALKGALVAVEPSGFERLAFWITALAPLLLLLGIICGYLEFKLPGVSLP